MRKHTIRKIGIITFSALALAVNSCSDNSLKVREENKVEYKTDKEKNPYDYCSGIGL